MLAGWELVGPLCESDASHTMWECPIMAHLSNMHPMQHTRIKPSHDTTANSDIGLRQRHMLCVSPDYCVNVPRYWLGEYADGRFDLVGADGPHLLDLGDILYAPNLLTDKHVSCWAHCSHNMQPA